jgi:hypothetical protein
MMKFNAKWNFGAVWYKVVRQLRRNRGTNHFKKLTAKRTLSFCVRDQDKAKNGIKKSDELKSSFQTLRKETIFKA